MKTFHRTALRLAALALLCLAVPAAFAGPDKDAPAEVTLEAGVAALLERAVAAGYDRLDFDDLWRAAVLAHGSVDPVLATLSENKADGARWVEAHLLERTGRWRDAKKRYEALAKKDILQAQLALGRAQDALGDIRGAWNTWKQAVKRVEDPAVILEVRVRMALLGRQGGASVKDALDEIARQDGLDPALRNRAAIVLALKGHPKEALALFAPSGVGKERFREQVRMADWALAAKDPQAAQGYAWNAYEAATLKRDRRYALTVVVEAHRADKSLQALIDRFAAAPDLDEVARKVWIDLLRETGQVEEAMRLFREGAEGRFTVEMRRELLEMCRESGEEERLVKAYRELIAAEPAVIEWREGLSRHFLERGKREEAEAVWASYLKDEKLTLYLLAAAASLQNIGLDAEAQQFAETSMERGRAAGPALLFLYGLHRARGRMDAAEAQLERLDAVAAPDAAVRMQLAESYERLGKKREAVEVLEQLVAARGAAGSGEDLEMHLAWLHSEVGNEEKAMDRWHALWQRVQSVPRRRYVEDRLMSVASRLGKLADIAIELEEKLTAGTADARDSGLLARLYTKANDPVSATEVIEEYMKSAGAAPVKVLVEKSRVFLACTDYHNYEKTIRELIRVDPDGEGDYLRQLAMSQLERGKPDEAREVLARLKDLEDGSDSAEFEAGVLALAGLREESVRAYRRGIARFPDRIESLLLMATQMAQTGKQAQAIGMFQHIAATAKKDDLFTIAIDGMLNLEASAPVLRWARRQTLGRLAQRHDKMYLYQLIADLSEEIGERDVMTRSLESALPIIGERRSSLLRELMDHTKGARPGQGNRERHLAYGRRLIGLGEIAPPQVYLDLGKAFLDSGETSNAAKTFALATDVPDFGAFQQQIATAFETAGYRDDALRTYQRLLVSSPGDIALMLKVGELQEQVGRDDLARELYVEALHLMIARRSLSTVIKEEKKPKNRWYWWAARNVDDFDQYYDRVRTGLLTTMPPGAAAEAWLLEQRTALDVDLASMRSLRDAEDEKQAPLRAWPRIESRAKLLRRAAIAFGQAKRADDLDTQLLADFPEDKDLLKDLVRSRLAWGLVGSARKLIDVSGRPEEDRRKLGYLVGSDGASSPGLVSLLEANRLFLPLLVDGKQDEVRALLRRLDFTRLSKEDQELLPVLQSCALEMADGRLALALGRHWIKVLVKKDKAPDAPYRFRPVLQKIQVLLDEAQYRSLCEYVVSLILDDPKQAGMWLQLIPQLQQSFEKPLLDDEQRKSLLEKLDGNRWYWIGSFFALVPEAERASVLRTFLPKVPASRRMQFLLTLVDQIEGEIQDEFAQLVVDSFGEAVKSLDRGDQFAWYGFLNLARGATNQPLRLRLCATGLEIAGTNVLVRCAHAVLLKKTGKEEEGLAKGLAALEELFGAGTHYTVNTAKSLLLDEFLPEHSDAFVAAVDKRAAGGGSIALTRFRLDLVRRKGDPLALLAAYEKAVEDHPKDAGFQNSLQNQLNSLGYTRRALQLLERMVEQKPEDKNLQQRLVFAWKRLHHPAKALALMEAAQKKAQAEGRKVPPKRSNFVSIRDVQKSLADGDTKTAAISLRRMWRRFRTGMATMRGFVYYGGRGRVLWPSTQSKKPDPKRLRGGLASFVEEEPERPELPDAYAKLAEYDFGRAEMARQMRTWESGQYASSGAILDGVAAGLAKEQGSADAVKALLEAARQGTAGKREYGLLLSLFESAPDEVVKDAGPVLRDLERTLYPTDAGSLRRLARVWVRLGDTERAARIYRWCGTRASAGGVFFWGARNSQPISAQELVKEVAKQLTGEERIRTVEAILQVSNPGTDVRFGPNVRDSYEALVLETWIDLVGADEALVRCRAICDRIAGGATLPQRRTASLAAGLLARAGEIDKASACLEVALCKMAPTPGLPAHMNFWFGRSGRLGRPDIRRLFPADTSAWKDAQAWFLRASELLPAWAAADRTDATGLVEPVSILMVRLHEQGETARAAALLPQLKNWTRERAYHLLWVADVARVLGEVAQADALEQKLFEEGRLNFQRVPEVVARLIESEGAMEALEMTEPLTKWTRHEKVLEALIDASKQADDAVRAAYWTKVAQDTEAAKAALEALEQSERAAR